ncbi:ABC transporter ATP-binding protein [Nocardioides sp. AE5]|uniref:ABC transporter ATP-binding protein n=1 Tax=Nocardioides sp. AE5 TaxID=2962573 RepID=UPI0028828932|nr:ABC transporter ATP-binding protein [Nocardioides sp. AE5]MDT0203221.1 ABC transporter ATP-binding protein [Nocardioides sp. AE5]
MSAVPTASDRLPLLEVEGLEVQFRGSSGWTTVVTDVALRVDHGSVLGLVGESGSGKSVTCASILRLFPAGSGRIAAGRIVFNGTDLTTLGERQLNRVRGRDIGMIFQEPMTSLNPVLTVGEQIAEVVRRHGKVGRQAARARAREVLDLVRIPNAATRMRQYPHEFSGGMRQRVMIAMSLATSPSLLIADEPTTALDVTIQVQILDLLKDLAAELEMGILLVTHDLGVVADMCDDVVVMYGGQVVETGSCAEIFAEPRHPYTADLMRARPSIEGRQELYVIPGRPPTPLEWPGGCRFAARCRHRIEDCEAAPVDLHHLGDDRLSRCIRVSELELGGVR